MNKINVKVAWNGNLFVGTTNNVHGTVTSIAPTFGELKKITEENIEAHVQGLVKDEEEISSWLQKGEYELAFFMNPEELETSSELYDKL